MIKVPEMKLVNLFPLLFLFIVEIQAMYRNYQLSISFLRVIDTNDVHQSRKGQSTDLVNWKLLGSFANNANDANNGLVIRVTAL